MYYIEIKNLKDLETLIDKLVHYISASDLSINEIKEKSRIITMLTYFSRYTISFSTILELYSKDNKKDVLYYVLSRLNLQNKEDLMKEFEEKYSNTNNQSENKEIVNDNTETNVLVKEAETILENDTNISKIIKEVENEVKHISVKKLDESELEEMKTFSVITDEERNYIRNTVIENKKIVKITSGGKVFEIKENNDVILIKIPAKTKLIIDKGVIFDYENETDDNNIFQKSDEKVNIDFEEPENLNNSNMEIEKEETSEEKDVVVAKKKRGRKPKNSNNISVENETIKRILDM